MILPDFTLVLQMINFCGAYVIMSKLIFAPALKILNTQDNYTKSLEQKIESVKILQTQVIEEQHSRWRTAKKSLYVFIPKLSQSIPLKNTIELHLSQHSLELSPEVKKNLIEKLSEELLDIKP